MLPGVRPPAGPARPATTSARTRSLAAADSLPATAAILAVKGLGGYHLAADAGTSRRVAALRARKHREDKPFAVMAADLAAARALCEVDAAAAALLTSPGRPDRAAAAPGGPASSARGAVGRARATATSGSCCRTPRCTTCCSAPWPARSC